MTKEDFLNLLIKNNEIDTFFSFIFLPENEDIKILFNSIINFTEENPSFNLLKEKVMSLNLKSFLPLKKIYTYSFNRNKFFTIRHVMDFLSNSGIEGYVFSTYDDSFIVKTFSLINNLDENINFIKEEIL